MKKVIFLILSLLVSNSALFAQVSINNNYSQPDPSAMLDVNSASKGMLIPRMTLAGINAIVNPADGLLVYCTDCGTEGKGAVAIYMAGAWYTMNTSCLNPLAPVTGTHVASPTQIVWNWNPVENATGYKWNTSNDYGTAEDMGVSLSKTETGLTCLTEFTRYVWVYSGCGVSSPAVLTASTTAAAVNPPTAGTHVFQKTQITWNWNPVPGAEGYKWNTADNYETATDLGDNTTKTETGLACETAYARHVWAYKDCGNSAPLVLNGTTTACWVCGETITKNHVTGDVAPVDKTVEYGTVSNIPGEPAKCWITQNLGASHQAANPYDASEASAGWYWQFNLKQGYQHDGIGRTPGTPWLGVNEPYGWQPANDPCAIELGTGWRIPTYTEYFNIDYEGSWTDYNGPWNSALKMHLAGYLHFSDGSLNQRGEFGSYWSSYQFSNDMGWSLGFNNSNCTMAVNYKNYGMTLRCIRE